MMTEGLASEDPRLVLLIGGDPSARARLVRKRLSGVTTPALLLTATPEMVDQWEAGTDTLVEVRADSPADNVDAWRAGALDPEDPVHAALAVGADSPLSALVGWEYVRRALEARFWSTVVVDLDGTYTAARRAAAVGELDRFVESHWPENQRFAAMAAGDGAEPRLREAHRIAITIAAVETMLAGPAEIIVATDDPGEVRRRTALLNLARGATEVEISGSGRAGFSARLAVPSMPESEPRVRGRRLHTEVEGVPVSVRLPAVLSRCELTDVGQDGEYLTMEFLPDRELWSPRLIEAVDRKQSG